MRSQGPFQANHGIDHGVLDFGPTFLTVSVAAELKSLDYPTGPSRFEPLPFKRVTELFLDLRAMLQAVEPGEMLAGS